MKGDLKFISIINLYMFEQVYCSSSVGTTLYIQQLVYVMLKTMELCEISECMYIVIKSIKYYVISKISDYVEKFWIIKKYLRKCNRFLCTVELLYVLFMLAGC
jgi:hypothetical protein